MVKEASAKIICNETGLSVTIFCFGPSQRPVSLAWSQVKTVLAYKRDIFAYDLICLAFGGDDGAIEVNEEMQGWQKLIQELPSFLPTPPLSEWLNQVSQPPFALSKMTLFKRSEN